jgi:hypothetical protein
MTKLTPLDRMFLRSIGLDPAEAALVCEALQAGVTAPQGDFLWREVELAMRRDGLDAKYEIDGPGLVQKLRKLGRADAAALREQSPVSGKCAVCHPFQRLRAVGLIR